MTTYKLAHFEELDLNNLEDYYDTEVELAGKTVEVDLTFEETAIDVSKVQTISKWLSDIQQLDKIGRASINEDYASGGVVSEYIQHHLDELDEEDLKAALQETKKDGSKAERMLSVIRLKRVGFYPHTAERFISLDYTLSDDLTDYLIVLDYTEDGKLHYITMES